jgi:ABC-type multidrug transport system fused ATPase/permease subunit
LLETLISNSDAAIAVVDVNGPRPSLLYASKALQTLLGLGEGVVAAGFLQRNDGTTETLTLISLIIVMILQDPIMTLVCSLLFPVIFWLVNVLSKRIRSLPVRVPILPGSRTRLT